MKFRANALPSVTFAATAGAIGAAFASVVLSILAALYLVPYGVIICTFSGVVAKPEITAGGVYFETPIATNVTVTRGGDVLVDHAFVPLPKLEGVLRAEHSRNAGRPLQIDADRHLTLGKLGPVLAAVRRAGYDSFFVFGHRSTVLELAAKQGGR